MSLLVGRVVAIRDPRRAVVRLADTGRAILCDHQLPDLAVGDAVLVNAATSWVRGLAAESPPLLMHDAAPRSTTTRARLVAEGRIRPAAPAGEPTPEPPRPGTACLGLDPAGHAAAEKHRREGPMPWMPDRQR